MRDFADDFHFADDGNRVHSGPIDRVAKELVAALYRHVTEIDGVARAVEQTVPADVDGVVQLRAETDGVGTHVAERPDGLPV